MVLATPPPCPSLQPYLPSWLELGFCHPYQHSGCIACQAPSIPAWGLQCPFCFLLSPSLRRTWTGQSVLPFSHSSSHRVLWKVWKVLLPLHYGGQRLREGQLCVQGYTAVTAGPPLKPCSKPRALSHARQLDLLLELSLGKKHCHLVSKPIRSKEGVCQLQRGARL